MKPVYQIQILRGNATLYTITSDLMLPLYFKDVLTDGVGNFNFLLPTQKGSTYTYHDIQENDTAKIWLAYNQIKANPSFVGKVLKISAPFAMESGYVRQISGLSLGEILLRRLKRCTRWKDADASVVATELADDLHLGKNIESDTNDNNVSLEVDSESYFDLYRRLSDYWVDAEHQVKKDFYIDINNTLNWLSRPIRTKGVEALTVGDTIKSYTATRSMAQVKNKIYVYGAQEAPRPPNIDDWTDSLGVSPNNWTTDTGSTLSLYTGNKKYGSCSIRCDDEDNVLRFKRTFSQVKNPQAITFWIEAYDVYTSASSWVRLLAPDESNYFEMTFDKIPDGFTDDWLKIDYKGLPTSSSVNNYGACGQSCVYDATKNPDGKWTETGAPTWLNIQGIKFQIQRDAYTGVAVIVDGIQFQKTRWEATVEDATSQSTYGLREGEYVFDSLLSDSECEQRGQTLLYQLKDSPIELEVKVNGNDNILIGDSIPMTIPAENINTVDFNVISVENAVTAMGWETTAKMVNTSNIRTGIQKSPYDNLLEVNRKLRLLNRLERIV